MNDEYPVEQQPAPVVKTYKDHLREWVTSDCKNKLCIDGYMSTDHGAYKCPICTRLHGSYPEFNGTIECRTDDEMAARLKDRKDVYFDREYRYRRGMEIMALLKSLTERKVA